MASRNLEPFIRPLLQTWFRLNRGMTLGVRGVVTDGDGKVLLVEHSYQTGWRLPGGGVERGETTELAMARELAEEAGVQPTGPMRLVSIHSQERLFRGDHILVYRISDWTPCPPRPGPEINRVAWFALDDLPADLSRGHLARLAEIFGGVTPDPAW